MESALRLDFYDLKNVEIISELRIFFLIQKEKLDENLKNSFQVFLDYLDKFFFRSDAIFNPSLFDTPKTSGAIGLYPLGY